MVGLHLHDIGYIRYDVTCPAFFDKAGSVTKAVKAYMY